jgi:hypothetical protein
MPFTRQGRARLETIPFETAIGLFFIIAGLAGLFLSSGIPDPLRKVLPAWETTATYAVYALAGAGLIVGVARGKAPAEGAGLVLLSTVVVVREIVYVTYLGLDAKVLVSSAFDLVLLWASLKRLRSLGQGEVIVKASP